MKGLGKEHICMTHRHRQQCGDGHTVVQGLNGGGQRKREDGDIYNSVKNKYKEKCKNGKGKINL